MSSEGVLSTSQLNHLQVIVKVAWIELDQTKPEYKGGSWHVEGTPFEDICVSIVEYLEVEGLTESFLEFRKPTIINEENVEYPQNDYKYTEHHFGITSHFSKWVITLRQKLLVLVLVLVSITT